MRRGERGRRRKRSAEKVRRARREGATHLPKELNQQRRIAIILHGQEGIGRVDMYIYLTWACRVSRTCENESVKVANLLMPFIRTSSSILASAISCSLPLPPAIFWASAIWLRMACTSRLEIIALVLLSRRQTYVGAELLQRVTLDGVDAQLRVGLDNGEATRHCHIEGIHR